MQAQEVVAKAVERNVVREDWESEEEVVPQLLEAQEAQEVQDHHSRHLPPDPAALADQEHRHQAGEHPLSRLGRPHRRGAGQTH